MLSGNEQFLGSIYRGWFLATLGEKQPPPVLLRYLQVSTTYKSNTSPWGRKSGVLIESIDKKHKAMLAPNDCLPTLCTPGDSISDIPPQTDVAANDSGHLHLPCSYKEQE